MFTLRAAVTHGVIEIDNRRDENKRKEDETLMNTQTSIFEFMSEEETVEKKPFKYISLFAGIGGFDFGLNAVGGECVFASEIDKFAKQVYTTLHGLEPHGDITQIDAKDIPDHDVIAAGFPCFVAGTLVDTDKGLIPIEDVNESHSVLTHENRYKKVVTPMSKIADRVLSIRVTGSIPTEVTFEHPYWVTERKDVWDNSKRRKVRTFSEPKWVDAQDLIPGTHYVGYAVDNREENPLDITDDEAYIIGRYIADGYLNTSPRSGRVGQFNRKVILCIGKDKIKDFVDSVGNSYHFGLYEDDSVYKCTATSQRLVDLCDLAGRGAENKVFPVEILSLPKNLLKRVVEGYLSGDGSYKDGVHSATTVSKHLAISLSKAVRKVYDVQTSITYTNRPPTCVIEGRTVRQRNTYKVQIIKEPQKETSTRIDGIIFSPVKSVEVIEKDVEVYNIEVEEDNSYTANGQTVHNCQAFSVAGKRGGFEDARGTLFFEVARIASEKQPKVLLLENVKGLIGHDSGRTLDTIVKTLNEIGYRVDFEVLNSKYFGVPQNRERIFISAVREDLVKNEPWNIVGNTVVPKGKRRISGYEDVKTFNFDWPTNDTVELRLKDVLESEVDEKYYLSEEKTAQLTVNSDLSGNLNYFSHRLLNEVSSQDGVAPTLNTMQGGHREPKINTVINAREITHGAESVYSPEGITPTITARDYKGAKLVAEGLPIREETEASGVNQGVVLPAIGASRGRNIDNPSDRTPGNDVEQRLELNNGGTSNTLTSVQKDNYVVEPLLRIRKLTPLECWRLQGFTDEQHNAVEASGISNSQRYKQAGNAVTVNVIEAIGTRLLPYL